MSTRKAKAAARTASRPPSWVAAAALVAITLVAYVPAMRGGYIWDDDAYVFDNHALRSLSGLGAIWLEPGEVPQYYPMTFTSLWIDYHLWGDHPFGFHLVNVLLHAGSSVLLWLILRRWSFGGAWVVAALFALHPLHVESVAWITERKNVLSGFLYLAAAAAYLRFAEPGGEAPPGDGRIWYGASFLLFAAAMLSKTVACSLPAALLLVLYWRRGRVGWRDAVPLVPFFALGLGLALVTVRMERAHVGAVGADWALSAADRILVAGRALWFYAGKIAWPHPLVFIYPRWRIDASSPGQWVFPIAAGAVVAALFLLRRRLGRGPLCAVLFFAGTLFPALGFVDVYPMRFSFVADHFCYLASIGLLALAVGGLASVPRLATSQLGQGLAAGVLVAYGALVWSRGYAYAGEEELWRRTLAQNPDAWIAHNNLGAKLFERGRVDEAKGEFEAALRLRPDLDDAHNNLGVIAMSRGQTDEAFSRFSEAVRITPTFGPALVNLAGALAARGRLEEGLERYRQALATRPLDRRVRGALPAIHTNMGIILQAQGQMAAAIAQYEAALAVAPSFAAARQRLESARLGK